MVFITQSQIFFRFCVTKPRSKINDCVTVEALLKILKSFVCPEFVFWGILILVNLIGITQIQYLWENRLILIETILTHLFQVMPL